MTAFVLATGIVATVPAVILLRLLKRLRAAGYRKLWCEVLVTLWIGYTLARMLLLLAVPGLDGWWMAVLCAPLLALLAATAGFVIRDYRRHGRVLTDVEPFTADNQARQVGQANGDRSPVETP